MRISKTGPVRSRFIPCSKCGVDTRAMSGTCRPCQPRSQKRPLVTCSKCGIQTVSKTGMCRSCATVPADGPEADDALTGGAWVPRRGVLVWQKGEAA